MVAEEPMVAAPAIRDAVEDALGRGETHYTDRPGILRLREKIAAALTARFGVKADAKSDLVVTCGVIEARFVALQQLLEPGQRVYAPANGVRIAGALLLRRAEMVDTGAGAKVVYLTSGADEETLRRELDGLAPEATVLFEVEEGTSGFHPAAIDGLAERTVTIGQLGHTSWQTGYLMAQGALSPGMRDFKQALTICSTNLSQWAALAAMETV
jgi:aspartate/methionine/tyrosine aminotransferase